MARNEYRLLVDEDLSPDLVTTLDREGFQVDHVQAVLGKGTDDEEVLSYATERELVIITNDTDFLEPELRGFTPIVYVNRYYQANPYETADVIAEVADLIPRNELPTVLHVSNFTE